MRFTAQNIDENDMLTELLTDTEINTWTTVARLVLALVLGISIGAERQARRRDAGLRTFTLICLGSAGAVIISIWIPQIYPDFLNGDPGRIAAQVLTGVGFLGAGAIARSKGGVQGLTTAACIWQTSIIGMTAGAGLYIGAILMTAMTLFILVTMERVERAAGIDGDNMMLSVGTNTATPDVEEIKAKAEATGARVSVSSISANVTEGHATISFRVTLGHRTKQSDVVKAICEDNSITSVSFIA